MNTEGFFQISADFELKKKPDWLDDFRAKYDLPYDYHITFKTTTYFKDEDLEKMKIEMEDMAKNNEPIEIIFDKLFIAPTSKGWCIMLEARPNDKLFAFQREISKRFSKYGDIISPERVEHEKNFKPHVTIGRHLTDEQLERAKSELGEDLVCDTIIQNLVLTTVKDYVFEEWSKPENRTFYKLNK